MCGSPAWLAAAVLLLALTVLVFAGDLRGPAVAVTVVDDAVVRWLASVRLPGLPAAMRLAADLSSWAAINVLLWGLLLALLILRRLRHLVVVVVAWTVQGLIIQYAVGPLVQRPRPFGVEFRTDWTGWALPSEQVAALVVTLMGILYGLVPEGRWRETGKWVATGLVALVAVARVYLGVDAPTDVLVAVVVGVAVPLVLFRVFTPNELFPISYGRGRSAHLDVGGARGAAIRRALKDQLGLDVAEVTPDRPPALGRRPGAPRPQTGQPAGPRRPTTPAIYVEHYNSARPHRSLDLQTPLPASPLPARTARVEPDPACTAAPSSAQPSRWTRRGPPRPALP
jgi:membrane-associated phospholipid phosphatase